MTWDSQYMNEYGRNPKPPWGCLLMVMLIVIVVAGLLLIGLIASLND